MSNDSQEILHLEGIGRTYGASDDFPALVNIDLIVKQGEFVAIVGASGAGKSTLLNVIGLLDTADTGNYRIAGSDTVELSDRERDRLRAGTFGFIFQDAHVLVRETVGVNAALGLSINNLDHASRQHIVAASLGTVGLLNKAHDLAGHLSGGERQRLAIARAIATSPRILLADEPTGSLDAANSEGVMQTLRYLNNRGVTVIIITHDPSVAASSDRIVQISDGRIVSDRPVVRHAQQQQQTELLSGSSHATQVRADTQSRWSRAGERLTSAISTHTTHTARAALLLLAFTVGAGGLVAAIGLSQTAAEQVVGRLDAAGLDTFLITPKNAASGSIRAELDLPESATGAAVGSIAESRLMELTDIRNVGFGAKRDFDERVSLLDPLAIPEQPSLTPQGRIVDQEYLTLQGIEVDNSAAPLRLFSSDADVPAAILGATLADELGYHTHAPGDHLWIGNRPVAIAGIITDAGTEPEVEQELIVNAAVPATGFTDDPTLIVRTEPGKPAQLAGQVGLAITPGDPSLFRAEPVADLRALTQDVAGDFASLITIVAGVLLVLSSLSAATATYLSVHARAAEIALRRAVGESKRSIWGQFVLEGLTVGTMGGVLGSALGVIALVLISAAQGWVPAFDLEYVGVGVAAGAFTGIVASLYPAAVAARQEPALAVRGT